MTPRPRFVARPRRFSKVWVVFDDLRGYTVSAGNTAAVAKFIAHSHEATWRAVQHLATGRAPRGPTVAEGGRGC